MNKTFVFALAAAYTKATEHTVLIDPYDSTPTEGLVPWQAFYDFYIDSLYAGSENQPAAFNDSTHLCYWRWTVAQPFSFAGDSRYSVAVVHNCPAEIIDSIDFDLSVSSSNGYIIVDNETDRFDIDNGVRNINLKAKTARGEGDKNDFGYWNDVESEPVWTYTYGVNWTKGVEETPEEETTEDSGLVVTRTSAEFEFFDYDATVEDIVGVEEGTIPTHAENLRNPQISQGLYSSSFQVIEETIRARLPDAFITGGPGPIVISQIEAKNVRYTSAGAGCRKFHFHNGSEETSTEWLGVNCDKDEKNVDATSSNLFTEGFTFGSGTYVFHEGIWDYITEDGPSRDWQMVSYLRGVEFKDGTETVAQIGNVEEQDFVHVSSQIVVNHLCGIDYVVSRFYEDITADYKETTYVNWRPIECEITPA